MATEKWNDEWSDENYEWPVTDIPTTSVVERLGKQVIGQGGRAMKEAHADRSVVMSFPNEAQPGTRIRKQIPRAECRRRAQVILPALEGESDGALKACVACDAMHLWPSLAAA